MSFASLRKTGQQGDVRRFEKFLRLTAGFKIRSYSCRNQVDNLGTDTKNISSANFASLPIGDDNEPEFPTDDDVLNVQYNRV